ncbi:MAG: Gfo/Idh/MocA family oxidoreductase [Oscillospiraceae bacterium]
MKFCVIGSGSIGKRHIRNIAAVCEMKNIPYCLDLFRSTKSQLSDDILPLIERQIYDFDELDNSYDAIVIANPTHLHYPTIKKFYDKSDCFFVEKPVFDDLNIPIDELLTNKNKKFYVACPLRYLNVVQQAKIIIKKEKINSVRAICSSYLPDWRVGQDYRKLYCAHKEQGGGVKIDLIHEWDYLITLFGYPSDVKTFAGKFSSLEIDSDDLAIYISKYDDFLLELHLDYFGKTSQRYFELFCDSGTYKFDLIENSISFNGNIVKQFVELPNDKYIKEISSFIDISIKNLQSINTLEHACDIMKISLS